jgi:hypothetical protein
MKVALVILHLAMPAHDFYSNQCCGGRDCHPVPCDEITSVGEGWQWKGETFDRFMLHIAPDGNCHVCVAPNFTSGRTVDRPTCIYLPPRT